MSSLVVAKFGGSSVRDGKAMERCARIIQNDPSIRLTIISATYNTTNELEALAKKACSKEDFNKSYEALFQRHKLLSLDLKQWDSVKDHLSSLYNEGLKLLFSFKENGFNPEVMDSFYALGERLSSCIFQSLLRTTLTQRDIYFFDAREVLITDSHFSQAKPQREIIAKYAEEKLYPLMENPNALIVTQGFIGRSKDGKTTTLGREGSDYSATLFGEALSANCVQIWTDVPGIASADPRTVENVRFINQMTYDQAESMASRGAKVLFSRTLGPVREKQIPVFVSSSYDPSQGGTWITAIREDTPEGVMAVTLRNSDDGARVSLIGHKISLESEFFKKLLASFTDLPQIEEKDTNVVTLFFSGISGEEKLKRIHEFILQNSSIFS